MGTDWDHRGYSALLTVTVPLQRDTQPIRELAPPGMALYPGWTHCPCVGPE